MRQTKIRERFINALNAFRTEASMSDEDFIEWLGIKKMSKKEMNEITYYTCLKMLSETLGKLPIKYFIDTEDGRIRAEPTEISKLLITRPNPYMTPSTFMSSMEYNVNQYGNGLAWIQDTFEKKGKYGGRYVPKALWVMPSNRVSLLVDNKGIFGKGDNLYYQYMDNYDGQTYVFRADKVIHFKTWLSLDGYSGEPVRKILEANINGMLSSQDYMNKLYEQGMTASMSLEYTGDIDNNRQRQLQKKYESYLSGAQNAGRVVPVPVGFKLNPLNYKLTDSQFFELKKYSALQIAGAFGIKPNQINDYEKSSYANSETQQLAFLVDTMLFKLKNYEEEINFKTSIYNPGEEFFRFNEKAILRADSKTQAETINSYINNGAYTVNYAKDILGLPHVEGGDITMVNGTFIPLTEVGNQYKRGE